MEQELELEFHELLLHPAVLAILILGAFAVCLFKRIPPSTMLAIGRGLVERNLVRASAIASRFAVNIERNKGVARGNSGARQYERLHEEEQKQKPQAQAEIVPSKAKPASPSKPASPPWSPKWSPSPQRSPSPSRSPVPPIWIKPKLADVRTSPESTQLAVKPERRIMLAKAQEAAIVPIVSREDQLAAAAKQRADRRQGRASQSIQLSAGASGVALPDDVECLFGQPTLRMLSAVRTRRIKLSADLALTRLIVVVTQYVESRFGATCDLMLYDSEAEALKAVRHIGGDKTVARPPPLWRLSTIKVNDAKEMCDVWEPPPGMPEVTTFEINDKAHRRQCSHWKKWLEIERSRLVLRTQLDLSAVLPAIADKSDEGQSSPLASTAYESRAERIQAKERQKLVSRIASAPWHIGGQLSNRVQGWRTMTAVNHGFTPPPRTQLWAPPIVEGRALTFKIKEARV